MRNPAAGGGGARLTDFICSGIGGRNTTARSIAQALPGSIRNGNGYLCRCPVTSHGKGRGDRNPSLSMADGDDGKLRFQRHRRAIEMATRTCPIASPAPGNFLAG